MPAKQTHISILAFPDAVISTLGGIFDVLNSQSFMTSGSSPAPDPPLLKAEIVGSDTAPLTLASGLTINVHKRIDDVAETDVVIVPSVIVRDNHWTCGRYPELVRWLGAMHERGAILCSACSGIFLLAETALFDGREATIHWTYAATFRKTFPAVPVSPEKPLIAVGEKEEYVSSGASASWHDLVLYLIARHIGPAAAQAAAQFYALQWQRDGLAPYIAFDAPRDHGDAAILDAQDWLTNHHAVAAPVEEMVKRSGLAERTFKRRFSKATGHTPISYVQLLRVEEAKRRLERTNAPIEKISWIVGYEDPAYFRRLFKRVTNLTPGAYRRKFNLPNYTF